VSKAKTRPKKSGASSAFSKFRSQVTRCGNIQVGLAEFKFSEDTDLFRFALPEALRSKVYRKLLWPCEKPGDLRELWGKGVSAVTSLASELEWAAQILLGQADRLNKFIPLRDRAEQLYLNSEVDELLLQLDHIEHEFGMSLWLVESRINAIQLKSGFKSQREYVRELLSNKSVNPFIGFVISWLSFRTEENLSAQEFEKLVDKTGLKGSELEGLIKITLGIGRDLTAREAAQAIAYTDALAPIDRYIFYITICQSYVASGERDGDTNLLSSLGNLGKKIRDRQLERLVSALGGEANADPSPLIPMLDAYVAGDRPQALRLAVHLGVQTSSVEALVMAVRIEALENRKLVLHGVAEDSLIAKIAADLAEVTMAGSNASDAEARLAKLRTTNPRSSWSSSLDLFIQRQRSDERINTPTPAQVLAALRTTENNPYLAFSLPERMAPKYLDQAFRQQRNAPSVGSTSSFLNGAFVILDNVERSARDCRMNALALVRQGDCKRAIAEIARLSPDRSSPLDWLEGQILLAEALLREGSLEEACEVCVGLILQSHYLARRLPLRRLIEALANWDQSAPRKLRVLGRLPIVILVHIFSVMFPNEREELLVDAFIDFLDRDGLELPSQISPDRTVSTSSLIYFFRHVCVPDALDQCFSLRSTRAVEDERVKIIVRCADLYAEEKKVVPTELQDELQRIKTRQVIRDTSLKLDQSKIYVDVDGIQVFIGNTMRDSWNLYRLLGMQKEAAGQFDDLAKALEATHGRKIAILSMEMPATERNILFRRMFRETRDQFASSKVFGLDANLSANVRHGYILRELRGPFVNASLVTNLVSEESGYRANKYWADRLQGQGMDYDEEVQRILARFSASIDAEIERLTRRKIKVRTDSSPDGLFDFSISEIDLQFLQKRVDDADTYEEYQQTVFDVLWAMTQLGLNRVKACLHEETLANFNNALGTLQAEADKSLKEDDSASLRQAISLVRPEVLAAVERVSSWFNLSKAHEYQDYPIQIAFDVGLATVTSYFSNLEILASLKGGDGLMMAGWTLPSIARLFLLLMENAALHSGIAEGELTIEVAVNATPDLVELTVINALSDGTGGPDLRTVVDRLNLDFGSEAAQDYVGTERGSGYAKLWKILRHDLRRSYDIEVRLTERNEFRVDIMFNREGVAR
jgi:hypothetical protein